MKNLTEVASEIMKKVCLTCKFESYPLDLQVEHKCTGPWWELSRVLYIYICTRMLEVYVKFL